MCLIPPYVRSIHHICDALSKYRTMVSSLSEQTAVFFLAGPQATKSLSLAGCETTPARGHAMEWEFEGQKVRRDMMGVWTHEGGQRCCYLPILQAVVGCVFFSTVATAGVGVCVQAT